MSGSTSQRAAALGVLFALIMLLIIYSSGSGSEVFPYSRLRGRARRPPDLKKWGVKSGYLPVCGNKCAATSEGGAIFARGSEGGGRPGGDPPASRLPRSHRRARRGGSPRPPPSGEA
ncbi:LOW QUALITY PROTEIN: alpha-N-acetylgalactosaminide alpha-2,6-sialyltransferase 6-like [Gavia stellata]|uniref:LOW QUALITY PROTEIN: alpha-N-acetylgalactosaminide alpha-2,6-sialyltransferase 6-like n=1 Tax=Gavia stellata TaxID=37040 RepID=UPI00289F2EA6|nr:LOW QUALITY PROTEIN: alpha-N-acetylgalactosaminide alpha-2,6-sialyltransferase 6-like [Gavia stellata]